MKRFLLIIFMCIPIIGVHAETFYTDYELWEENVDSNREVDLDEELYKIEKKDGYNNYEVISSVLGYYPINKPPLDYTYYDTNDYQIVDTYAKTPYSKEDSIYNTNRIKNIKKAGTIVLRSFITNAYLRDLVIRYKGTPINYTYQQTNYNSNDTLSSDHLIAINLLDRYDLEDLELEFTFYDNTLSRLAFMLNVYQSSYALGTQYDYFDNELYRHKYTEKYIVNFVNEEDFLMLLDNISWIKPSSYSDIYSVPYYKSSYNKYNYYLTYNNYLNIYTKEPIPGYLLDYEDKKDVYDYYIRDYISVDDTITDVNNIHLESSLPLEDITTTYNEETNYLMISYDKYTFYKKVEVKEEEPVVVSEPEVVKPKPITTTKKVKPTKKRTTTTTTKPVASLINQNTNFPECTTCKDNSLKLKIYKVGNSVLLIIVSIMCKHYVFNQKH